VALRETLDVQPPGQKQQRNKFCIRHGERYNAGNCSRCIMYKTTVCEFVDVRLNDRPVSNSGSFIHKLSNVRRFGNRKSVTA
jgi:hypothetical protein